MRHPASISPPGRIHCRRLRGGLRPFHRGSAGTAHRDDCQEEFKAEKKISYLILSLPIAVLWIQSVLHRAPTAASPCAAGAVRRACQVGGARAAIGGFKSAPAGTAADTAADVDWQGRLQRHRFGLRGGGRTMGARPQNSTGALPWRSSATGSWPKSDTSGARIRAKRAVMSVRGVISARSGAGLYVPLGVCSVEAPGCRLLELLYFDP